MNTNVRFEDWSRERMQDPEFRAAYEALEPVRLIRRPRAGWDEQFRAMTARGDDRLLDAEAINLTQWYAEAWEWS